MLHEGQVITHLLKMYDRCKVEIMTAGKSQKICDWLGCSGITVVGCLCMGTGSVGGTVVIKSDPVALHRLGGGVRIQGKFRRL